MKRFIFFFFFILLLLFSFHFLAPHRPMIIIDNHQFTLDIVTTQKDQEIGLAKYHFLPTDKGMYFLFSHPDLYRFWMKNMQFPIDIIFLRNGKIIDIFSSIPAPQKGQTILPTYGPSSPADSVLEINAGLSARYGFKTGDKVKLTQ